jgi:menaquinone-dependent protoporphyrinogen IX oxidase
VAGRYFEKHLTMKALIIYKGKYGATQQYAHWLSEELYVPVATTENYDEDYFSACDTVILGSSVYIGQLQLKQ